MSTYIWTPGHAGPLDELVGKLTTMVAAFADEHSDGSRFTLATASAEPGFGFFSFTPYRQPGDEPKRLIVPIGAVRSIEISAPDPERPFGFVAGE